MIDFHTHILPGIDDGAKDIETSVQMVQTAMAEGITAIACTSHYSPDADNGYEAVFRQLGDRCPQMQFLSGMEYDYDRISAIPPEKLRCIGSSKYLLIDLKEHYISPGIKPMLFSLRMKGFRILLAHPERLWHADIDSKMADIQNPDFFFQVNSGSILGGYGKSVQKAAFYILEHGLCHLIADDAHNAEGIRLKECRESLSRMYPQELLRRWFETNPALLMENRRLAPVVPDASWKERLKRWKIRTWG